MTNTSPLLITFLTVSGILMPASAQAGISIDVGEHSVMASGGLGGYQAFPDICRLQDGRLMTIFYDGYAHISVPNETYPNGGRISYVTSSDEGETWSPLAVLYDTPDDDRDPSIAQLPNGDLLCTFFQPNSGVSLVRSSDDGRTWSAPQLLTDSYYTSSPIRHMSDGTLALGLYYEPGDGVTANGAVMTSSDNGVTWNTPVDIPNPSGAYLDAETDVIELNNGHIWAVQRSSHSPAQYSVSTDKGATWSNSQTLDFVAHCPYLHRSEHDDMILMGYRAYYSLDGWGPGYTGLRYSLDECRTWSDPIVVDRVIGAYPSMVNLNDGSVFVTYYEEGGGSNIRGRRMNVRIVDDPPGEENGYLGKELLREGFEIATPDTQLNGHNGWSGDFNFVISSTVIDESQSVEIDAGVTWPGISKSFSHTLGNGESYILSGTLFAPGDSNDYAQLSIRKQADSSEDAVQFMLGYGDLIFAYEDWGMPQYEEIRVPNTGNSIDVKAVIADGLTEFYYRENGETAWTRAGSISSGVPALYEYVHMQGHGGYVGGLDSVRLAVLYPRLPGDANLDGIVNDDDAVVLAANWLITSDATWYMGDFNNDGAVDGKDAAILAANWRHNVLQAQATVPEPNSFVLLIAGLFGIMVLRRTQ